MKTCVLISGLPRRVKECYSNIYSCLIEPNNADVFIHSWINEEDVSEKDFILNNYNPKKAKFEKQKSILNSYLNLNRMMATHGCGYTRPNFVSMLYSQFYSILQANLLKEEYRLENDIYYDCVVRARFDIIYNKPIFCKDYNMDAIYTPNCRILPPEMIDDRFAFGPNYLMNLYCSNFNLIESIYEKKDKIDGIICGETLVFELIKQYNIKNEYINELIIDKIF